MQIDNSSNEQSIISNNKCDIRYWNIRYNDNVGVNRIVLEDLLNTDLINLGWYFYNTCIS